MGEADDDRGTEDDGSADADACLCAEELDALDAEAERWATRADELSDEGEEQ